jgi:hypothetical protein
MKNLIITPEIELKLFVKHCVRRIDVVECFHNRNAKYLEDNRVNNKTNPPTLWFIAETHKGILLKIVAVFNEGKIYLKTAYQPNEIEIHIYKKYAY